MGFGVGLRSRFILRVAVVLVARFWPTKILHENDGSHLTLKIVRMPSSLGLQTIVFVYLRGQCSFQTMGVALVALLARTLKKKRGTSIDWHVFSSSQGLQKTYRPTASVCRAPHVAHND